MVPLLCGLGLVGRRRPVRPKGSPQTTMLCWSCSGARQLGGNEVAVGDHVYVSRVGYTHHGIEVNDEMVIHFSGEPRHKNGAVIRMDSIEVFAAGGTVLVREYAVRLDAAVVATRAESKLGESGYSLYSNNCEHFARWCVADDHFSPQVNGAVSATAVVASAGVGLGGVSVIGAVGYAGGMSAASIMSGLATVGGAVGAGAVGGLVALGAAPGVLSALAMRKALHDDETLNSDERASRKMGRSSAVAGAAGGSVAGIAAVGATGVVTGLSGAGITSGLAAVGGLLGGGMAAGTAIVLVAPAIGAAGVGYAAYRLSRVVRRRRSQAPPDLA